MSFELATLPSASATSAVNGSTILSFEESLTTVDGILRILSNESEWAQSALKHINEIMENQMVVHNGVNFPIVEATQPIFSVNRSINNVPRASQQTTFHYYKVQSQECHRITPRTI